ncbi:hypothetical protein LTR37_002138 [Vermiconidia calcicola]|uniref:Uncharacterized protein n=1 Tax=Vermiconidia calcicola TaxID=1690605 RepID=A0ACC3NUN5_9PEZI|nr:hypothetical protein LTR37_002138 [Vermiconidia calcicola]
MGLDADRLLEPVIWRKLVQSLVRHASIETLSNVGRQLDLGRLYFKQALLITALCPRLRILDLHFSIRKEDDGDEPAASIDLSDAATSLELIDAATSLGLIDAATPPSLVEPATSPGVIGAAIFMLHAAKSTHHLPMRIRPVGFQAIRKVSIHGAKAPGPQLPAFAPVFLLQSVSSIYMRDLNTSYGIWQSQADLHDYFSGCWYSRGSAVQHLFFEGAVGPGTEDALTKLISCPQTLKSVIFKDCRFDGFEQVVHDLVDFISNTLETMIFGGDTNRLNGDPSTRISKVRWENVAGLKSIRALTVDVLDMFPAGSRRSIIERAFAGESHERFLQRFTSTIPRTVETLIF